MKCKNCSTELASESSFCYTCGGKIVKNRLTIRSITSNLVETYFSYDNTFLRTFLNLFRNPDDVINSYVVGVRRKYIAPFSFFVLAITISGLYLFIIQKYFPEYFDLLQQEMYSDENTKMFGSKITEFTTEYNSLINFILIPFLAFISWVVFSNKRYNFTEHLVIYFYTMPFLSIVSVVLNLFLLVFFQEYLLQIMFMIYGFIFIYHSYVLKRIFSLSFKQLVLKTLLFIPIFFLFYVLSSILLVVILFATGNLVLEDFAPKA
jgi:hypothetical protein